MDEATEARAKASVPAKRVNLALQGGGAHGAFTWGVLDRLLEDHRIEFDGVCGTSAGAMNAAVLASGYATDGPDGARLALESFWRQVSEAGRFGPFQRTPRIKMKGDWAIDDSPGFLFAETLTRHASPYQWNPLNVVPLAGILEASVDFDMIRHASGIKLFICATNVRTGKCKVFHSANLSVDVLLASACLPQYFQAVEIDGEYYWDGGYTGNPALYPLAYESEARDLVVVQIDPLYREEIPKSPRAIHDRLNEITFNAVLIREMQAIHFVNRLVEGELLDPQSYKRTYIHLIEAEEEMKSFGVSSMANVEWVFFENLKNIGRKAADRWIGENFEQIGKNSTIDVAKTYL